MVSNVNLHPYIKAEADKVTPKSITDNLDPSVSAYVDSTATTQVNPVNYEVKIIRETKKKNNNAYVYMGAAIGGIVLLAIVIMVYVKRRTQRNTTLEVIKSTVSRDMGSAGTELTPNSGSGLPVIVKD